MIRALVFAVLLGGLGARITPSQTPGFKSLVIDCKERIEGLTIADLQDDGRRDLIVQTRGGKRLLLWFQTEDQLGFQAAGSIDFPEGCAAWCIADLVPPKGPDIVMLFHDGVRAAAAIGPDAGKPKRYASLPLIFPPDHQGPPSWWDWGQDLNGDGLIDLPVPGLRQDWLILGAAPGTHPPTTVPIALPESRSTDSGQAHLLNFKRRRPRIAFHPFAHRDQSNPGYQDDTGIHWIEGDLEHGFKGPRHTAFSLRKSKRSASLLESSRATLRDWNGDGLIDLVFARSLAQSGSLTRLSTELAFHAGKDGGQGKLELVLLLPGLLSSGPHLEDVDGDGRRDLFLCIGGGSLKSEIARRLLGRAKLDYHLYLNHGGDRPFARSPELSIQDSVPTALFSNWGRRHRLFLRDDWNGDGLLDLLRLKKGPKGLRIAIRHGERREGSFRFSPKDSQVFDTTFPYEKHQCRRLIGNGCPALILQGKRKICFISLER